jgi:hypothetical protein
MSSAKLGARLGLLCAAALAASACGGSVHPAASSSGSSGPLVSRGRIDDPRTHQSNRLGCLLDHHLPVQQVGATGLQIGPLPAGPTVTFEPTPGVAQGVQIQAEGQGAEVIGSALLYPNQAPDGELSEIENCLSQGVQG